jgi:hypothetical protein
MRTHFPHSSSQECPKGTPYSTSSIPHEVASRLPADETFLRRRSRRSPHSLHTKRVECAYVEQQCGHSFISACSVTRNQSHGSTPRSGTKTGEHIPHQTLPWSHSSSTSRPSAALANAPNNRPHVGLSTSGINANTSSLNWFSNTSKAPPGESHPTACSQRGASHVTRRTGATGGENRCETRVRVEPDEMRHSRCDRLAGAQRQADEIWESES